MIERRLTVGKNSLVLFSDSLIDPDVLFDPEKIKGRNAKAVNDAIIRGASVEDLLEAFNYEHLKDALAYYNIRGRSNLTYMKDMATTLIRVLGDGLSKQRAGTKRDTEFQKMKDSHHDMEDEIFQLKQKVRKLEVEVEKLEKENKKLKKYEEKYNNLKSTVNISYGLSSDGESKKTKKKTEKKDKKKNNKKKKLSSY